MCIRMENTNAGHSKFYAMELIQCKDRFTVQGQYGRIGQAPLTHTIYAGSDELEALAQMKKKQLEKQKKGYIVVSQNGNMIPTSAVAQKKTPNVPLSGQ